jgi:bis(5'-adenosyl)-triphosphatase
MDDIYPALEQSETSLPRDFHNLKAPNSIIQHHALKVDADEDRLPRTLEEMEKEATWLRGFFTEKESHDPNAV